MSGGLAPSSALAPSSTDTGNTPQLTAEKGRVKIAITALDGNLLTVTRRHPSGRVTAVRGMNLATLSNGAFLGYDYEAPIGVEITYQAQTYVDPDTPLAMSDQATITWTTDNDWLKDPLEPIRNIPVRVQSIPELDYTTPTGVYQILGRPDPVTISQIRQAATGTINFVTLDQEEADLLQYITSSGHALLFQSEYAKSRIGNLYLAPLSLKEQRVADVRDEDARVWSMDFQEVGPPIGDAAAFTTWNDVLTSYLTWQAVIDANFSWFQMIERLDSVSQPPIVTWRGN